MADECIRQKRLYSLYKGRQLFRNMSDDSKIRSSDQFFSWKTKDVVKIQSLFWKWKGTAILCRLLFYLVIGPDCFDLQIQIKQTITTNGADFIWFAIFSFYRLKSSSSADFSAELSKQKAQTGRDSIWSQSRFNMNSILIPSPAQNDAGRMIFTGFVMIEL